MDPVSIIGLAGSVVGIVDIISKSINSLRDFQSKYHQADLIVDLSIVQLSTLRTALNQVTQWIDELKIPQQHQFIEDLTISLQGCKVLVLLLDTRIDEFPKNESTGKLTSKGKIELLWEDSEMKEYQNLLNNQINALNLLLTAIQCRSKLEQTTLLSSRDSRRIMRLAREDTSSLLMLGEDTESICTIRSASTQNSSLLDVIFEFDGEVFNSKAYHAALISTMMQILSRHHGRAGAGPVEAITYPTSDGNGTRKSDTPAASITNHAIDGSFFLEEAKEQQRSNAGNSANDEQQTEDHETEVQQTSGEMAIAKYHHSLSEKNNSLKAKAWLQTGLWKYRSNYSLSAKRIRDAAVSRHIEVEKMLALDAEKRRTERKLLVLGAGSSGKSTLQKSMRLLLATDFGSAEREAWKKIIRHNLWKNAYYIMSVMKSMELSYENFEEQEQVKLMDIIESDLEGPAGDDVWDNYPGVVCALEKLWKDTAVQGAVNKSNEFRRERERGYMENETYFFNSLHRIAHRNYIPSNLDVFSARLKTTGVTETTYSVKQKAYRVYDHGGMRGERKKWIHSFENAHILVFVAELAGFNEPLLEDKDVDCMEESLMLFQSLSQSRWFLKTSIILLFTKVDKLGPKLKTSPLENTFSDYSGGSDIETATAYITEKFVALIPERHRPLCVSYASIVEDERSMARVVFNGIDYLSNDSDTIHKGHENASYFIMGEDGIPRYQ